MLLHFYKMNGAGNDFIVIDNRDLSISLDGDTIAALCDRHRGIGADGLLAVEPAEKGADYKFRYYNADGGEAEMCGNGARCFGFFTSHLGDEEEAPPSSVSFETIAGNIPPSSSTRSRSSLTHASHSILLSKSTHWASRSTTSIPESRMLLPLSKT